VAGRPDETGGVELEPGDEDDVGVADVSAQLAADTKRRNLKLRELAARVIETGDEPESA
jgi:hypothetical protein